MPGAFESATTCDPWDRCLYQLSAQPRRQIVVSLLDVPDERRLPLPEAAITEPCSVDLEQFEVELRHHHLPKLANAGYVRWEEASFRVQRGPRYEEAETVMRLLLESSDRLPDAPIRGWDR